MARNNKKNHVAYIRLRSTNGTWLVHQDLRRRLVDDALETETNLTDVVVRILGDRYGVDVELSGRTTAPSPDDEILKVLLPNRLWAKVCTVAIRAGRQPMNEIRLALADHYGLTEPAAA